MSPMTTEQKASLTTLHPQLSWAQLGMLVFIHENSPTKAELHAATDDSEYTTENRLRELKRAGMIIHKQEVIRGRGVRFGESRYHLTEQALTGVPAGTE